MKASWSKEKKREYDRVYKAAEWADPVKRAVLKARHKKWKESPEGKAWCREYNRLYRIKNKKKLIEYEIKYKKQKMKDDPIFRKNHLWKDNMRRVLRRQGEDRDNSMLKLVGCKFDFFIRHLENQFKDGMTWRNRGTNGWCIDHVRPKSTFDLSVNEQWNLSCNWRNLQPMWHRENSIKGKKYTPEMELDWINLMEEYRYRGDLFLRYKH